MPTSTKKMQQIEEFALDNGASKAAVISSRDIDVKNRFAAFCKEPKCPNFGRSMSCPPHVSGPEGFRKKLKETQYAVAIRLEVDAGSLIGEERPQVFRILQEIVAATELKAKSLGFTKSEGFAGGSCKQSFCSEHDFCRVLSRKGTCRYPDSARPSMSGFGVNVGKLMKCAGWSSEFFSSKAPREEQMMWLAGVVLLK
ncbi:Predicted metal-binding protein [Desulfocicer vacuolatum DSM 3385]|uniref:Predicted metal-binding protein n=1 Tax=Desulfocicer vacuolatum DSM 3385 TaxID=1121400 RepID=A0A1W1YRS4_9BACT|nr:DUF2284 domain-containing protein [Desulfocicer vacuolatum]SMC38844.1 Predicted metal-binding protein [Desulfocicer vacuolatum DSM 3385]